MFTFKLDTINCTASFNFYFHLLSEKASLFKTLNLTLSFRDPKLKFQIKTIILPFVEIEEVFYKKDVTTSIFMYLSINIHITTSEIIAEINTLLTHYSHTTHTLPTHTIHALLTHYLHTLPTHTIHTLPTHTYPHTTHTHTYTYNPLCSISPRIQI